MAEIIKSQAIVLSSIRWKESSKIVSLFSRDLGKIKVIARGALRKKNPFGGKLEALNVAEVIISQKQSRELQVLTSIDVFKNFNAIRSDILRFPFAMAVLELLNQIFDDLQAETVFFDFTIVIIEQIAVAKQPQTVFWYFVLKLCSYLGFKPDFSICKSCSKTNFQRDVYFSAQRGGIYCYDCAGGADLSRKMSKNQLEWLQLLQNYPHRRIGELTYPDMAEKDYSGIFIEYLNYHLEAKVTVHALDMYRI